MLNKTIVSALIGMIIISFNGCGGVSVAVPVYVPAKKQIMLNNTEKAIVDNGALILNNGDKIFDENGEIIHAYTLKGKVFYLLLQKNQTFALKDSDKKLIKNFEADRITTYNSNDDILFAIHKQFNPLNIMDTVYKFDGRNLTIINKNVKAGGFATGIYNAFVLYSKENDFSGYKIVNITNNKIIKMPSDFKHLVGAINDKIFYIDREGFGGDDSILKMYNPTTQKSIALVQKADQIQLLKAGDQVVLRIFMDKNLKATTNKFSRYISLNRLEEVSSISSDFKPIILHYRVENNHTKTWETYTIADMEEILWNMHTSRTVRPFF
jgi:hypothetical protein